MKNKVRKQIQEIIDKEYLTDWEFVIEKIAPEIEAEDFDVDEVCKMIYEENLKRGKELHE